MQRRAPDAIPSMSREKQDPGSSATPQHLDTAPGRLASKCHALPPARQELSVEIVSKSLPVSRCQAPA